MPGFRLCGMLASVSDTAFAMQIPQQWWVPAVAEPARREANNTRREISLKEIIQVQLGASADTVWLPKYLLVVYQLSM